MRLDGNRFSESNRELGFRAAVQGMPPESGVDKAHLEALSFEADG